MFKEKMLGYTMFIIALQNILYILLDMYSEGSLGTFNVFQAAAAFKSIHCSLSTATYEIIDLLCNTCTSRVKTEYLYIGMFGS